MKDLLLKYTRYNLWANTRVCGEFLKKLDGPLWDKPIVSSFSSIRKTLYHIWGAEELWLMRVKGVSLDYLPNQKFIGSADAVIKKFLSISHEWVRVAGSEKNHYSSPPTPLLEERGVRSPLKTVSYTNTKGEKFSDNLSDIILHVVNHSTYHRGQLVTMLRNAGFTDLSRTDFIEFCR